MNLYEWPTANPAPKPTRYWGLDKSYKIVQVRFKWLNLYLINETETASRWQQVTIFVTESFIQSIHSNGWFI